MIPFLVSLKINRVTTESSFESFKYMSLEFLEYVCFNILVKNFPDIQEGYRRSWNCTWYSKKERKPDMEMEYEDPNDILYEMFGVDNDEDLDEALDSWAND